MLIHYSGPDNFFVLCTNMKVYSYNFSEWVELSMTWTARRRNTRGSISLVLFPRSTYMYLGETIAALFCVLDGTSSLRRFFWVHMTYVLNER